MVKELLPRIACMIVNTYAVVDGFLSVLRLGLGLLIVWIGLAAWWKWKWLAVQSEGRTAAEDRSYLLFLLAHLLLWLNVASWPVLYLLLQSFVPEWPGVMCIYGVSRIGTGSLGLSRFLPTLLMVLQVSKPVLVFLNGAWFVLHLVNRDTRSAPLSGKVLMLLAVSGLLAVADATAEIAYLIIPKKEEFAATGCCTAAFDEPAHRTQLVPTLPDNTNRVGLYVSYYALNLAMVVALAVGSRQQRKWWLAILNGVAVATVAVNAEFLVGAAAPHLLGLPYHHCPYDLITQVPESIVAVALFLCGCFAILWAGLLCWIGEVAETRLLVPPRVHLLLQVGLFGYLGSLLMTSVALALA